MPRKKKSIGVGANVKVLLCFTHPSAEIRANYTNPSKGERLCDCLFIKKGKKVVSRKEQVVIFFRHDDFPNVDLYAVTRYILIVEEGPSTYYFNDGETDEAVEGEENNGGPEIEEDTSITDVICRINPLRIGGEVERQEFENVGLVVDNDPLPENTPTEQNNTDNECSYQE